MRFILEVFASTMLLRPGIWALAAGCEVAMPLADQFWADRYGHVRDSFGFLWSLASRKEELTSQELQECQAKAFAAGHP